MNVRLELVKEEEKEVLKKMFEDYEKEILRSENPEGHKYFDSYWQEDDRWPFFIKIDRTVVGFILANKFTVTEVGAMSVAEFYIKNHFRKGGVGKEAAKIIFDEFRGKWEVRELKDNLLAQKFWRNVIAEYTDGKFKEVILDNDKWQGPVQIFES